MKETRQEIEQFIRGQLSELLDVEADSITVEENLLERGATSMVIVQLYVALQEEYGVHLEDQLNLFRESISIKDILENILQEQEKEA